MRRNLLRLIRYARQHGNGVVSAPPPAGTPAPVIAPGQSFSSSESASPGSAIGTVSATNATGFTMTGGGTAIAINASTGALTVGAGGLDYETTPSHPLAVSATGPGGSAGPVTVTVNVTDVADVLPTITPGQTFSILESVSSGTTVGTVLGSTGDSATTAFAIVSGNTGTKFSINSAGVITTVGTITPASFTLGITRTNSAGTSSAVNVGVTVTEAASMTWPSAVSFTPNATATHSSMSVPAYLTDVADAKFAQTTIRRISDATAWASAGSAPSGGSPWNCFGPVYPLRQHWNADDTLMLCDAFTIDSVGTEQSHFYNTASHILNGLTGAYIKPCRTSGQGLSRQWRWSNADPDLIYYIVGGETVLRSYVPSTDTFGTVHDFSANGYVSGSLAMYGGDGDASLSDRYHAFNGSKSGGQWYVAVWDKQTNTIVGEVPVAGDAALNLATDAFGMSKSGTYLWIKCNTAYTFGGSSRPAGVAFFNRDGTYLRSCSAEMGATNTRSHVDCALDSNGNDVWVHFGSVDGVSTARTLNTYRIDGTGNTSSAGIIQIADGYSIGLYYFSGLTASGWAIYSDMAQPTGNDGWELYPTRGHVFAIKLDQSGDIYPICESRFSTVDWTPGPQFEYNLLSWACSNRGLTRVMFKSAMSLNWSGGIPSTFHAYLAKATA